MLSRRMIAIIAFIFSGWIIVSLASSEDVIDGTIPLNPGPIVQGLAVTLRDILLTLTVCALSVAFYWLVRDRKQLAEAIRGIFTKQKRDSQRKPARNLSKEILGFVLLLGIIFGMRSFGLLPTPIPQQGERVVGNTSVFTIPGLDGTVLESSLLSIYHFFAVWAFQIVFIAIGAISAIILVQALLPRKAETYPLDEAQLETVKTKTAKVLQMSAKQLEQGADYRESVLECYRRLCRIFESRMEGGYEHLTARELQAQMVIRLNLSGEPISQLTGLFEEARYSCHAITGGMRDMAVSSLHEIVVHLRQDPEESPTTLR